MTGFFYGKAGTIHARPFKSSTVLEHGPRAASQEMAATGATGLPDLARNPHIMSMNDNAFFPSLAERAAPQDRPANAWRTLPLDGHFDLVYEDATGAWSNRSIDARELKLGPGRTLLGGIDARRGGYRGFRVDRIRRLVDGATGERIETGILDRLLGRAEAQRRADALRIKRQARARRRATARPVEAFS